MIVWKYFVKYLSSEYVCNYEIFYLFKKKLDTRTNSIKHITWGQL